MKKKTCEFRAVCVKNHQESGVLEEDVCLKVLGDDRTTGYICAWMVVGTVLWCPQWKRYSVQTEGDK